MDFVKVKYEQRILKLRASNLTETNLCMIFKLRGPPDHGIYLNSENEGEIILPDADGRFRIDDFGKTYVVNGDTSSSSTSPSRLPVVTQPSLGLPLSYQSTSRPTTNPPPNGLVRPQFSSKKSSGWKKSFMVVDISSSTGSVTEKFQVHLTLDEGKATVEGVASLLKEQLGYAVTLLDAKYLPIQSGETTKGAQFWRSSRKIMAAKTSEIANLKRRKDNKRVKANDFDFLEKLREIVQPQTSSHTSTQPPAATRDVEEEAKKMISNIFHCSICFNTVQLPAAVCSRCFAVIGCVQCIEQWYESLNCNSKCPLCRTSQAYKLIPVVREIAKLLGQPCLEVTSTATAADDNEPTSDPSDDSSTIPYGAETDDQDDDSDLRQMI